MLICLNKEKVKGFYLDSKNELVIPFDFLNNRAIDREYRAFFSALVKEGLLMDTFDLNENDLAEVLEKVGIKMNQDLLSIIEWLENHKYLEVKDF